MKKIQLIIATIISSLSFGQITLEHTYTTQGFNNFPKTYSFYTDNGLFFFTINATENKVLLHNSSHELYKTVSLNLGSGYTIGTLYLASNDPFIMLAWLDEVESEVPFNKVTWRSVSISCLAPPTTPLIDQD